MSYDRLYVFNKKNGVRTLYGEVQTTFNMSLTCDGTKESCKVEIFNNQSKPLEPYTIAVMSSTQTWWVVQKDKVMRYANEIGGYYKHTISLLGAFELLNVRELTNCGFNANKYTIQQFLTRLFSLSSFEYEVDFSDLSSFVDLSETITYLKTFQNYTLGSAIKELFNGMNLTPRLRFTTISTGSVVRLSTAYLGCYSRSGNNETPIDVSTFDNEEEQSSFDGENFGTKVLSNVENCVSANVVRYPAVGGVKATSDEHTVDANNAKIKLPSNVYKANRMIIYMPFRFETSLSIEENLLIGGCDTFDVFKERIKSVLENWYVGRTFTFTQNIMGILESYFNFNYRRIIDSGGYYNNYEDTYYGSYLEVIHDALQYKHYFNSIQYSKTSKENWEIMAWEQGKDYISNLHILDNNFVEDITIAIGELSNLDGETERIPVSIKAVKTQPYNTFFAIEYVPMSDVVVKVDNDKETNDTHLYNQNGKLVDSNAVSKLINSHSEIISSDEIVRYGVYYDFDNIPKPSQRVIIGNDVYVINNVSVDLHENDDDNYYMECMFTMTKNVACKSIMVSANTNIRDYECPQQNNVKRIQTYRDYVELSYDYENTHNETPYLSSLSLRLFNITNQFGFTKNYTFTFSVDREIDENYCYQIGTTKYEMNKQTIIVADFKDNNIISYDCGNAWRPIRASNVLDQNKRATNTPVSYVEIGGDGSLTSLTCRFVDENDYLNGLNYSGGQLNYGILSSFQNDTFSYWLNEHYDIAIDEPNYNKDGLEVPVFEYCCQVGNSNGIVFGDDFLKQATAISNIRIIAYHRDGNIHITQENYKTYIGGVDSYLVSIGIGGTNYTQAFINYGNVQTTTQGKTIMLVAQWYDNEEQKTKQRFLFALNNCKNSPTLVGSNYLLLLGFNNWRLR